MKTSIYLVHGTWPEGLPIPKPFASLLNILGLVIRFLLRRADPPVHEPLWYKEGSTFRCGLSKQLDIDHSYIEIRWSGKNSLRARLEGASQLKAKLIEGFQINPQGRHVVVAHSHGGNAVMYGVDSLDIAYLPHGIATLATPFLEIRRRKILKIDSFLNNMMLGLGGILYVSILGALGSASVLLTIVWMAGVPCLFIFAVIKASSVRLHVNEGRRSIFEAVKSRRLRRFGRGRPSLLVIRANNDEATITLTISTLASLLNRKIWHVAVMAFNGYMAISKLAYILLIGAFSIIMSIVLALGSMYAALSFIMSEKRLGELFLQWNAEKPFRFFSAAIQLISLEDPGVRLTVTATVFVFIASLSVLGIIVLVLRFIGRLSLTPFGTELFFIADTVVPRVNTSPTGILVRFYLVPDADVAGGLRHAVYRSLSAHVELAKWIRSLEVNTTPLDGTNDRFGRFVEGA